MSKEKTINSVAYNQSDIKPEHVKRFWSYVKKPDDQSGCWEWTGGKIGEYGAFKMGAKQMRSHRYSFLIANGYLTAGLVVMHSCDNPCCVNPSHLSEGFSRENIADMDAKGRRVHVMRGDNHWARKDPSKLWWRGDSHWTHVNPEKVKKGSSNPASKITEEVARAIKQRRANGEPQKALAVEYGVHEETISRIHRGKLWGHIQI